MERGVVAGEVAVDVAVLGHDGMVGVVPELLVDDALAGVPAIESHCEDGGGMGLRCL